MKNVTAKTALQFWIYLVLLILAFANISKAQEMNLVLKTTSDDSVDNSRFMAVGWSPESSWIPAPPAPPGNAFYMYIADTYRFKDIAEYKMGKYYEWTFEYSLPYDVDSQLLYIDTDKVRSHTEYTVVLDVDNNIISNLTEDSVIVLNHDLNNRFKIRMFPIGQNIAPISFLEKPLVKTINEEEELRVEMHHVFISPQSDPARYSITANGKSVIYSFTDNVLTVDPASIEDNQVKLTLHAENSVGYEEVELILKKNVITNIDEQLEHPNQVGLTQNYPNPFNPTTTINYNLPIATEVQLHVYNSSGQLVSTLVNGPQPSGSQSVIFEASNLPSGMYIYRLVTNDAVITKKMTLIK